MIEEVQIELRNQVFRYDVDVDVDVEVEVVKPRLKTAEVHGNMM